MLKMLHSKKGFTLIELMIVVAIIGILAAIAIPNFLTYQLKSRQSEARTNLGGIRSSESSHNGLFGCYMGITTANGVAVSAAVPLAAVKSISVQWNAAAQAPTVIPAGQTWCQAAGPGSLGNFPDLGFAATGNVFFHYAIDTFAVPQVNACVLGAQVNATGANAGAPSPGGYVATASANLDGAGGDWSQFAVSDSQSVSMCSSPSMF